MPVGLASELFETIGNLRGTVEDVVRRRGDPEWRETLLTTLGATPRAVTRTVPWLLKARNGHDHNLLRVALDHAARTPDALALEMDDEQVTWAEFDERTSRIAHILHELGVRAGDVVALLGENSPSFLCALFGISRIGATASLLNYNLEGNPLAHAIRSSRVRVAIVQERFAASVRALGDTGLEALVTYDEGDLEERMKRASPTPFPRVKCDAGTDFVYIFTSGTTGLPKPCKVTHARTLMAGAGFGPILFDFQPGDKLYSVLPLYHSSALMIGVGSCFITRTPLAMRRSFSAKAFWSDARKYRATAMLYIGELCRYLVNTPPTEDEKNNLIRVAVGNGLRADVWEQFQKRFDVAAVREFYSATESPGFIYNLTGKVGSVGHVPFRRMGSLRLARYDVEKDELVRDSRGRCIECDVGEVGELLVKLKDNPKGPMGDFRGYTDKSATEKKILKDVFKRGDRYFSSGDLMRFDENDYFYFVDRIGDTYRWKGENVSTAEVAEVIGAAPGVKAATVSSVHVPGAEGQAGLAALECDGPFDAGGFWRTAQGLPSYAQPRFVRVLSQLDTTGTFKVQKTQLRSEGVDPVKVSDPLFVRLDDRYAPLTPSLYQDVVEGRVRL